jgi:nucleoside-diphosphate-sugar epimerase
MRILIIGGTRFIGLATTRQLSQLGHTVLVFNRGQTPVDLPVGVRHIAGDVDRLGEATEALRAFAPEVVLHNIALHAGHVREVQAVLGGIARKLVLTSSMDVYRQYGVLTGKEPGPVITEAADETSPVRTVPYPHRTPDMPADHRLYHYDKIPAEQAALNHASMPGVVVRLPMVIGEGDAQRRLRPYLRPMLAGRPALVLDEAQAAWRSTYGYVENMAHALVLAVTDDRAAGQVYNAADGSLSILALAERVKTAAGWGGRIVTAPAERLPQALHWGMPVQDLVVRAERIGRDLGYQPPVAFDEGLRRTVAWELANPPATAADPGEGEAQEEALRALGLV